MRCFGCVVLDALFSERRRVPEGSEQRIEQHMEQRMEQRMEQTHVAAHGTPHGTHGTTHGTMHRTNASNDGTISGVRALGKGNPCTAEVA